jgi:hypothetical protein
MLDKRLPKCYNKDTKREANSQKEDKTMAGQSIWCTNYDWDRDITQERRAEKKRWNGKVITTSNQWRFNDHGSSAVSDYSETKLWEAVAEHRENEAWC